MHPEEEQQDLDFLEGMSSPPPAWGSYSVHICPSPAVQVISTSALASSCSGPSLFHKPSRNPTTESRSKKPAAHPFHFWGQVHLCLKSDQRAGPHCHDPPPCAWNEFCWGFRPLFPMSNAIKYQLAKSKFLCISIWVEYC